jgi:thiamine-phosphate pyrophosphorylase
MALLWSNLFVKIDMKLPRIYPITNNEISTFSHVEQVKQFIKGGASLIQFRDKHSTSAEFYKQAKLAQGIAKQQDVTLLINDRIDIALAIEADGVHLGQNDLSPIDARELLGKKAIIGYSTHTISQAISASKLPIDYIAIGPIFATSTKENPDEIVGLDGLQKVREAVGDFPLVAIGGITPENAVDVWQFADSVAVIGAILKNPNGIADATREFTSQ